MASEDILASNLGREENRHTHLGAWRQPIGDAARNGKARSQEDPLSPRTQGLRCSALRRGAIPGVLETLRLPARPIVLFASLCGHEVVCCTSGSGQSTSSAAPTRDCCGCQGGALCGQASSVQEAARSGGRRRVVEHKRIRGLYSCRRVRPARTGVGNRGGGFGRKLATTGIL